MALHIETPDGFFTQTEFVNALNQTSIRLVTSRYLASAFKHGLLKKDAMEVIKKGQREFWFYPKTWVATIEKNWADPNGKLPKPRAKRGSKSFKTTSKTSYKAHSNERNINITIPSKEALDALTKRFKDVSGIARFLESKLKEIYEPTLSKRNQIIEATRAKIRELELMEQSALEKLDGGEPVSPEVYKRAFAIQQRDTFIKDLEAEKKAEEQPETEKKPDLNKQQ